jgi:hypothetical protein
LQLSHKSSRNVPAVFYQSHISRRGPCTRNQTIDEYLRQTWLEDSAIPSHGLGAPSKPQATYTDGGSLIDTVLDYARRQEAALDAYAASTDEDAVPPAISRLYIPLSFPGNTLPEDCHTGKWPHYEPTIGVSNLIHETDNDSVHITQPDETLRFMRHTIGHAMIHSQRCSSVKGGYFRGMSLKDKEDGLIDSLIAFGEGQFTSDHDCVFDYADDPVTGKRSFVATSEHPDLKGNYYSVYLVDYEKPHEEKWTSE